MSSRTRSFLLSGALAGAAAAFAFTALHHVLISNIWFSVLPMMAAGALCGICVAWTYGLLFDEGSLAMWLLYNGTWMAFLVLLGVASIIVYEPITTIPALLAANEPPRELIARAMPLTIGFTIASAAVISGLWGRTLPKLGAILVTSAVIIVLLGLNVSVLGLVYLPTGTLHLVAKFFGLIFALNAAYAAAFLLLERRAFFGLRFAEEPGFSSP